MFTDYFLRVKLFQHLANNSLVIILFLYSSACLIWGGAGREGYYWHGMLQASAALIAAGLILTWPRGVILGKTKIPIALFFMIGVLGALYCIPIPIEVWQSLPGRSVASEGFSELGVYSKRQPLSLDVDATLSAIGYVLPPLAVLLLSVRIGMRRLSRFVPWYLLLISVFSVMFGLLQVFYAGWDSFHLYEFAARGLPTGFFSNPNHQASFLLLGLPFATTLFWKFAKSGRMSDEHFAITVLLLVSVGIMAVGVLGTGSVAGYLLLFPTILLSIIAAVRQDKYGTSTSRLLLFLAVIALAFALVIGSPIIAGLGVTSLSNEEGSRVHIWLVTLDAARDLWPIGSGLGTYESVIPLYENPESVEPAWFPQAHNEYLQTIMEGGILGLLLLVTAALWFVVRAISVWSTAASGQFQIVRKMAVVSLVVLILHSAVDYPARTIANSVIVGLFAALISLPERTYPKSSPKSDQSEINPKRVVL